MGQIGSFGSLIRFEVSDDKVLGFNKFSRTVKGRWGKHDRIGIKPFTEFLGADLEQATMTVHLNAQLGVNPRKIIKAIRNDIEDGEAHALVIGGSKIGTTKFRITQMSDTWNHVLGDGELISADVNLTFEEYM